MTCPVSKAFGMSHLHTHTEGERNGQMWYKDNSTYDKLFGESIYAPMKG